MHHGSDRYDDHRLVPVTAVAIGLTPPSCMAGCGALRSKPKVLVNLPTRDAQLLVFAIRGAN